MYLLLIDTRRCARINHVQNYSLIADVYDTVIEKRASFNAELRTVAVQCACTYYTLLWIS